MIIRVIFVLLYLCMKYFLNLVVICHFKKYQRN